MERVTQACLTVITLQAPKGGVADSAGKYGYRQHTCGRSAAVSPVAVSMSFKHTEKSHFGRLECGHSYSHQSFQPADFNHVMGFQEEQDLSLDHS